MKNQAATTHPSYSIPLAAAANNYAFAVVPPLLGATANSNDHDQCQYHQVMVLSEEQEKRILDAWTTKLARSKRRMARQLRASLKHSTNNNITTLHYTSNAFSSSSSSSNSTISVTISPPNDMTREDQEAVVKKPDLYNFYTPDNKRLRMVLKKELKNSDVGSLGRIVLPKREAENRLPILTDKEGVQVMINDIYSDNQWALRYKYWLNNKSRMYVLENTGDFVRKNGLEMGDSITLYEDEFKNLYVSMKKRDKYPSSLCESSCKHLHLHSSNCNDVVNRANKATRDDNIYAFTSPDEEDMTSLELFLKEPQDQASNSFVTSLSRDYNRDNNIGRATLSNYINDDVITKDETNYGTNQISPQACSNKVMKAVDDHYFDDCYGELGMLPEVNRYKHYDYLALFDPMVNEKS